MNENTTTTHWKTLKRLETVLRNVIARAGNRFNALSLSTRKTILLASVTIAALVCASILFRSFAPSIDFNANFSKIRNYIPMDWYGRKHERLLTPLGRLADDNVDNNADTLQVAIDREGQVYTHPRTTGRLIDFDSPKGWEKISRQQLDEYVSRMKFIPYKPHHLKR